MIIVSFWTFSKCLTFETSCDICSDFSWLSLCSICLWSVTVGSNVCLPAPSFSLIFTDPDAEMKPQKTNTTCKNNQDGRSPKFVQLAKNTLLILKQFKL